MTDVGRVCDMINENATGGRTCWRRKRRKSCLGMGCCCVVRSEHGDIGVLGGFDWLDGNKGFVSAEVDFVGSSLAAFNVLAVCYSRH